MIINTSYEFKNRVKCELSNLSHAMERTLVQLDEMYSFGVAMIYFVTMA